MVLSKHRRREARAAGNQQHTDGPEGHVTGQITKRTSIKRERRNLKTEDCDIKN